MEIYFFTLVVLLLFSVVELRFDLTEYQYNSMTIFVYCLFVFQLGFRWQTGTDWVSYLDHYNEIVRFTDINTTRTGFEKGYSLFVLVIKYFSNNYTVFLIIHSSLFYYFIFNAFKKFSPFLFISLLVFYATSIGTWGANRQFIALGICFFALQYISDKNALKFFALIALATTFHSTAILFSVFYFFDRDIKQSVIISTLLICAIIGKTNLPYSVFSYAGGQIGGMGKTKALLYIQRSTEASIKNQLSIFGLIRRLIYLAIFMLNYNFLAERLPYYKILFNGFIFGLIIYFLFSSTLTIMVNRGSLYFIFLEGLLISCQLLVLNSRVERGYLSVLLFIVSIFFLLQSISGYEDLFVPYKGVYINTGFYRFRLE